MAVVTWQATIWFQVKHENDVQNVEVEEYFEVPDCKKIVRRIDTVNPRD